jgi:hypothetical protein
MDSVTPVHTLSRRFRSEIGAAPFGVMANPSYGRRRSRKKNPAAIASEEDGNNSQYYRGIGAVGRDFITRHYRAYGGPKPPPIDHQGTRGLGWTHAGTAD